MPFLLRFFVNGLKSDLPEHVVHRVWLGSVGDRRGDGWSSPLPAEVYPDHPHGSGLSEGHEASEHPAVPRECRGSRKEVFTGFASTRVSSKFCL